jgi:hypothetical protein
MAKSKVGRFRSAHETGISIFLGNGKTLRLEPDESYETEDPAELDVLRGSDDVREMESSADKK